MHLKTFFSKLRLPIEATLKIHILNEKDFKIINCA